MKFRLTNKPNKTLNRGVTIRLFAVKEGTVLIQSQDAHFTGSGSHVFHLDSNTIRLEIYCIYGNKSKRLVGFNCNKPAHGSSRIFYSYLYHTDDEKKPELITFWMNHIGKFINEIQIN